MKNLSYISVLLFVAIFCSFGNERASRYFEGRVTYEITYPSNNYGVDETEMQAIFGARLEMYFKKGESYKQFYDQHNQLISQSYLDLKEKKSYRIHTQQDTVYWFDITKADTQCDFEVLADTTLLDHDCKHIKVNGFSPAAYLEGHKSEFVYHNYYSKELPIKPKWFKHYEESDYNDLMKLAASIPIKKRMKNAFYTKELKMVAITPMSINDEFLNFRLRNKVLKEL